MFDLCLNALAVHGHLIVIGMTSQVILAAAEAHVFSFIVLWFVSDNIWRWTCQIDMLFTIQSFKENWSWGLDDSWFFSPFGGKIDSRNILKYDEFNKEFAHYASD